MSIINRKAKFEYEIIKEYTAGIQLLGSEVKSLREGKCDFTDSYIYIDKGEVYLLDCNIPKYKPATVWNHEEKRKRKLLLNKREIESLFKEVKHNSLTIVPLKIFTKGSLFKLLIGLARGKKTFDKKQTIKERDISKQTKRELNNNY